MRWRKGHASLGLFLLRIYHNRYLAMSCLINLYYLPVHYKLLICCGLGSLPLCTAIYFFSFLFQKQRDGDRQNIK